MQIISSSVPSTYIVHRIGPVGLLRFVDSTQFFCLSTIWGLLFLRHLMPLEREDSRHNSRWTNLHLDTNKTTKEKKNSYDCRQIIVYFLGAFRKEFDGNLLSLLFHEQREGTGRLLGATVSVFITVAPFHRKQNTLFEWEKLLLTYFPLTCTHWFIFRFYHNPHTINNNNNKKNVLFLFSLNLAQLPLRNSVPSHRELNGISIKTVKSIYCIYPIYIYFIFQSTWLVYSQPSQIRELLVWGDGFFTLC